MTASSVDRFLLLHVLEELRNQEDYRIRSKKAKYTKNYDQFIINGIPITKLCIRNITPKQMQLDLKRIFSQFGPVLDVQILTQAKPRLKKCAIVTFEKEEDAEKALQARSIIIAGGCMFVFPAYGICEAAPDAELSISSGRAEIQSKSRSFKELSAPDGLPYKFPKDLFTLPFLKGILTGSGAQLKKLNLQNVKIFGADALIETIVSSCNQLVELRLQSLYINDAKVEKLKSIMSGLEVLSLKECNPIKDFHLESLVKLSTVLRHLEITGTCFVKGDFLCTLDSSLEILDLSFNRSLCPKNFVKSLERFAPTLHNLCLTHCRSLRDNDICDILEKLPNIKTLTVADYSLGIESLPLNGIMDLSSLEELDLSYNEHCDDLLIEAIVDSCPLLRSLNLSHTDMDRNFGCDCIVYLHNMDQLRSLNLSGLTCFVGEILQHYAEAQPPIESLYLAGCHQLCDEDIICVLKNCKCLKHLDVSGCTGISKAVPRNACSLLEEEKDRSLHMIVGGTQIGPLKKGASLPPKITISWDDTTEKRDATDFDDNDDESDEKDWTPLMFGVGSLSCIGSSDDDSDYDDSQAPGHLLSEDEEL